MNLVSDVPALYREMLILSHEMLKAADEENWDELITLEQRRFGVVETLQTMPELAPETQQERDELIGLIHEIQKCDERVRPMIVSWMAELRAMFESAGNELKLGRQYGAF